MLAILSEDPRQNIGKNIVTFVYVQKFLRRSTIGKYVRYILDIGNHFKYSRIIIYDAGTYVLRAFSFSCYGSGTEPYQFRSTIRKTVGLTNVDIRRKR